MQPLLLQAEQPKSLSLSSEERCSSPQYYHQSSRERCCVVLLANHLLATALIQKVREGGSPFISQESAGKGFRCLAGVSPRKDVLSPLIGAALSAATGEGRL